MLVVWTAADVRAVREAFTDVFKSFRPIPPHRFVQHDGDLYEARPDEVVLTCGSKPLATLQQHGVVPKNRTVGSTRGKLFRASIEQGEYLISYDPGIIDREPEKKFDITWDVRLAHRYLTTGTLAPPIGTYRWVDDLGGLIDTIRQRHARTGKPVDLAFDTETMGLYPWYKDKRIVAAGFTIEAGSAEAIHCTSRKLPAKLHDQVRWLLDAPEVKLRGANLKYDLVWVAETWGIECTNFRFDSLLAGSLIDENRSNSLNMHAKIYTSLGGYDDCVAPDARLLTADLRWVPAGEVQPGDELVGFDEDPEAGHRRKLRVAVVKSVKSIIKPGYRLHLSNGTTLSCSADHGFLTCTGSNGGGVLWRRANQIPLGQPLKMACPVVEPDPSFDAGWMSGFLDGEGYVSGDPGMTLGWSQKSGLVWDRANALASSFGIHTYFSTKAICGVHTARMGGWPSLIMLQRVRPVRLLAKRRWVGRAIPNEPERVSIVEKEWLGKIEVMSIETSTHTFVAEGICSHNSFNAKHDKGHMELVPEDELLPYLGGDVDACVQASEVMRDELLADDQLANFYVKVLHPASRVFEKIERRGVLLDKEKYEALGSELATEIQRLNGEALRLVPRRLRLKHMDKIEGQLEADKSPFTPKILKEYFFGPLGLGLQPLVVTEKSGEPSTARHHLRMFADRPEARAMCDLLEEINSASKTLSTFVLGFLKHLRPDGRLHPTYMLYHGGFNDDADDDSGTVTGRLSAKDPAFQTLPKKTRWAKRLRECFVAPSGKRLWQVDFNQGELRVVACVAPEERMIEAYRQGLDLHAITAASLAGFELDEFLLLKKADPGLFNKLRTNGKAGNFGLLYGMSPLGFQAYAWANYGVKMSEVEAEAAHHKFLQEQWVGLPAYHKRQKLFAKQHGHVRSPLGRVRHLPHIHSRDNFTRSLAERQAINSPIQSSLSDMMLLALDQIEQHCAADGVETVGMIHDAAIGYVPEEHADELIGRVVEVMSNLPLQEYFGWSPPLDFPADAESGPDLAHLCEMKF